MSKFPQSIQKCPYKPIFEAVLGLAPQIWFGFADKANDTRSIAHVVIRGARNIAKYICQNSP